MESAVELKGPLFRRRYESTEKQPLVYLDTSDIKQLTFRRVYSNNPHASGDLKSIVSPALK